MTITNSQFISNTAQDGGGIYVRGGNGGTSRIANTLFARNTAGRDGAALYLFNPGPFDQRVEMLHTTIASPTVGAGTAIVVNNPNATVELTNTIIASYTIGLSRTQGVVSENYNLFYGNITNRLGVSAGVNSLTGFNPAFADQVNDDYHLTAASIAINAGADAGVLSDFEGDTRPNQGGFDIGYDESAFGSQANLGIVKAVTPNTAQAGQAITYTLAFSNASPYVATGVVISDIVSSHLSAISYQSSGVMVTPIDGVSYTWQAANLTPEQDGFITITGLVSPSLGADGLITNTATITTITEDTKPNNNTSAVSIMVDNNLPGGKTIHLPIIFKNLATAPGP